MFWLLLFFLGTVFCQQDLSVKELRPCFERYANHRLVNVLPFHSEWKMRSEEQCLRFCALSSSRCRAVVYDSVQHICHYFLDGGLDVAVPAAKMIYLRVTSKQCLDERSEIASNIEEFTPETVIPPIPVEREPLSRLSAPILREEDSQETGFAGSFDVDIPQENEVQRDIKEPEQRWLSSMEKLVKNDEDMAFKKPKAEVDVSADVIGNEKELQTKLQRKLEMLQEKFPDKYVEYVKGSGEVTTAKPTTTTEKVFNMRKTAKAISFSKQTIVPKILTFKNNEIRRKPVRPSLKQVALKSFVAEKARLFLESVNGQAQIKTTTLKTTITERYEPTGDNGCDEDFTAVWVTFENSLDRTQGSIDSQLVGSKEECQDMCNQMNCRSFSFFDKESQCQINSKSDGVHLKKSPEEDFSASTSTRFCYSKSLPVFNACNNFIGFRDLSVQVQPREQFDGLPKGHAGMQYCIELCVLSSEYICRSASFLVSEGRCLLNSDDSLTKPDLFNPTLRDDHLYFENACSSPPPLKDHERDNLSVERIVMPKASPMKSLQIKKLKPSALKVQSKADYQMSTNDESIFAKFFSKFF